MKILKFGGKSLDNGLGLQKCIEIITAKKKSGEKFAVVVSARGNTTDVLLELLEDAKNNTWSEVKWQQFKDFQTAPLTENILQEDFAQLEKYFNGVKLLQEASPKTIDSIVSFGEIMSAKTLDSILKQQNCNAVFIDSRNFLKTNSVFGNAQPYEEKSAQNAQNIFSTINWETTVPIVTGYIGSTETGETTTLGRNGSNYSASLLANFLDAELLENYTHVDGIFTVNPELVEDARFIESLSYQEANEMVSFGMNILHAKTLIPLIEKNIPIVILNTFKGIHQTGTYVSNQSKGNVKSISVLKNKSLVVFEGSGLLGKVGVDARIFKALGEAKVSVSIVSQGSSERGIGLVVDEKDASNAICALQEEFKQDILEKDVEKIYSINDLSVVSIIGQKLKKFNQPFDALVRNNIEPLIISNTITGDNIGLLIKSEDLQKTLMVIHGELFESPKQIHLAIFGHGTVGKTLINQILESREEIAKRKNIQLNIVAVANSKKVLLNKKGISAEWEQDLAQSTTESKVENIIQWAKEHHLENLIAIDNTASSAFVENYDVLAENAFDLVSSNKIFNTLSIERYRELREKLEKNNKRYLYETNVGAGLPLIDTIKLLHLSGENITRIIGVFSGTLSYIFNHFSVRDDAFSTIVKEAMEKGFTEPDPREDLSGNDVARKLLILARELDLINEFDDISVQNLIPPHLREMSKEEFLTRLEELNDEYENIKKNQTEGHVLRYVGDLHGDLSQDKGVLDVKLISVPKTSALGQLKGSDSIFEIYTESYGENPIVIMGAGAGANVTARGVFGDILRLSENK